MRLFDVQAEPVCKTNANPWPLKFVCDHGKKPLSVHQLINFVPIEAIQPHQIGQNRHFRGVAMPPKQKQPNRQQEPRRGRSDGPVVTPPSSPLHRRSPHPPTPSKRVTWADQPAEAGLSNAKGKGKRQAPDLGKAPQKKTAAPRAATQKAAALARNERAAAAVVAEATGRTVDEVIQEQLAHARQNQHK